jgi:hypothetical protein
MGLLVSEALALQVEQAAARYDLKTLTRFWSVFGPLDDAETVGREGTCTKLAWR